MLRRFYIAALFAVVTTAGAAAQDGKELVRHMNRGVELFDAGRYRAAQTELEKARKFLSIDDQSEAMKLDYLLAVCAGKADDAAALDKLRAFEAGYPNSIYTNEVRFAIADRLYGMGDYEEALREYVRVDSPALPTSYQDEYNFKRGHSYFMLGDYINSYASLRQVGRDSEYTPHARYYVAYIDYVNGDYAVAKRGFEELANVPAYEKVIPFYLLQIEYLQRNYDYVLREGDALMAATEGERKGDIARIMAETWFIKEDYGKAIDYMNIYIGSGGAMGREEYYLLGFSQYMFNEIGAAIESLVKASGPDDQLTQNASYHLGAAYLLAGNKRGAMQAFSMASASDYSPAIKEDALFNYGKLQYELGGGVFNEAINILNRYITEYPDTERTVQAREYLISAYYNSNNYEAAYEAIKLVPNPDNNIRAAYQKIAYFRALEYYNKGDFETAYRLLDESLANRFNAKYTALTEFWKAEILYRKADYRRAIPLYREYVSLAPKQEAEYALALYNLGYSYFNMAQWGESRTWFDRFLASYAKRDSYRADALNRIGDIYYANREFPKALDNYNLAAAMNTPERYYSQYSAAVTVGLAGNSNQKISRLESIIAKGEGDFVDDAVFELGNTYVSLDRFNDASTEMLNYINKYPNGEYYLSALSQLGLIYQNLGNNAEALRYYSQVVDKAPASPQARAAMIAVRGIYVDMNDVDSYFAFAQKSGMETDVKAVERDSLAYAAAEKVYLSNDVQRGANAMSDYIAKYPRGNFRPNAYYYLADCYVRIGDRVKAIENLAALTDMYYNQFTVRGLEKLSALAYEEQRYAQAATAYKKLASTAVNPATVGAAWDGYIKSYKAIGDNSQLLAAANDVLAASGVPAGVIKQAKSIKAGILRSEGKKDDALVIYKELAVESSTAEGAEATYYVIESQFEKGQYDAAEKAILDFAAQNTPHSYWLGKSFLVLGDIYVKKGDSFQARATLQSIVDGYSPADDGIVDAARERINELK